MSSKIVVVFMAFLCFLAGCEPHNSLEQTLAKSGSAIARLHVPGRSCTAFHVGNDIFLTAAHCINNQSLVFIEYKDDIEYLAVPILTDESKDLAAVKTTKTFPGGVLKLRPGSDGRLLIGTSIVAIGYPGYFGLNLTFETGVLKSITMRNDEEILISNNLGYPGESGGPVIETASGQVVGLNAALIEQITAFDEGRHLHNTISLIISSSELENFLNRVYIILYKKEKV